MKTYLDCIPCVLRQALEAARLVSDDTQFHTQVMRKVLSWAVEMDLNQSPPHMAQRIHRLVKQMTGNDDPYKEAKQQLNALALEMLPDLREKIEKSSHPLMTATRLAIAGNVIDLGVKGGMGSQEIYQAIDVALQEPLFGDVDAYQDEIAQANTILYLADNAGEIAFDRLLIEQLLPKHITLVTRSIPVINDATLEDAKAVGLDQLVEVIGNGSDAPGTILEDCSPDFCERFSQADLILSKGQGNFETLSDVQANILFLFKAKCAVIQAHINQPLGTSVLVHSKALREM
jgi:uncharacterized protein with ATP-grasp and redox domains